MNPAPPVTSTRSPIRRRLRVEGRRAAAARRARVAAALTVGVVCVGLIAGCGDSSSSTATGPKRAAEPAEAPPLRVAAAGRSVYVGHEPEGLAWDAEDDLIAVGLREPDQIAFVDPDTLRVVSRIPLPAAPRHLAYDSAAGTVLVPAESANELLAVRPGRVVYRTKVGIHPHDATSVGGNVFVADEHSDQMSMLHGGHVFKTFHTPHQPGGITGVGGRWVALVAVSARVLEVYSVFALKPIGRLPAGVGPSHIVAGPGGRSYVADTQGEEILVYDIGRHSKLVGKVAAPGTPYGLALTPTRLWVTDTATNRLTEYETVSELPRPVASYPTVRQPNSVAVDGRTGDVFVAGRASGRLQRITPKGRAR